MAGQFLRETALEEWKSEAANQGRGELSFPREIIQALIALIDDVNCTTTNYCRWAFDCIWIPNIAVSVPLSQPLPRSPLTVHNQRSHARATGFRQVCSYKNYNPRKHCDFFHPVIGERMKVVLSTVPLSCVILCVCFNLISLDRCIISFM